MRRESWREDRGSSALGELKAVGVTGSEERFWKTAFLLQGQSNLILNGKYSLIVLPF